MKQSLSISILIFALFCFWSAGWVNARWSQAVAGRTSASLAGVRGGAPLVVFTTVALGGFRGLIADLLWLRAGDLQEDGRYFEVVQLADWITKLEPTSTEVWAFHAWNMAYNISVMFPEGADRWRWVQHGLHLLRNEGLRYNPGDSRLYWELGWIYQDKIGGVVEEFSPYYSRQFAIEMETFFPGGRWDPRTVAQDADRERAFREELQLTPDFVTAIDREFGPLDWRLPESHSLYWAWRGTQVADGMPSAACDRMMYLAIFKLFEEGRLLFSPARNQYLRLPRVDLSAAVVKIFDQVVARQKQPGFQETYAAFLREVILYLFAFERLAEAEQYWQVYMARFPGDPRTASLAQFVGRAAMSRMGNNSPAEAENVLELLVQRQAGSQAAEDMPTARGYERLTELLWNGYVRGEAADGRPRDAIPSMPAIRTRGFQRAAAKDGGFPPR